MNNTHIITRAEITFWSIVIKIFNLIQTIEQNLQKFYSRYTLEINISLTGFLAGLVLGIAFVLLRIR